MEELIEVMAVSVNSCTENTGKNTGKYVSNQNLLSNYKNTLFHRDSSENKAYYTYNSILILK